MKDRIINIVFAAMSVVFGIVLILVGVHELGVDTDVAADEDVIDTMIFIVPGILLIADAAVYMLRSRFRSNATFILGNIGLVSLAGFLMGCIYFQFIHYGISRPQLMMMVPAILIILVLDILVLVMSGLYTCVYTAASQAKKGR